MDEYKTAYNIFKVHCNELEINVQPKYTAAILKLISNYKPINNDKGSSIKLSIVPYGRISFRENPSRVSAKDREFIRKQMDSGHVEASLGNYVMISQVKLY